MHVVGSFTVIDDENTFVWICRFEDAADRERILRTVHQDPGAPPWPTSSRH
jgi:hypothetical protein